MPAGDGAASRKRDRVPRLVADCDPTRLELTPAQGFLLSRIDGVTPESVLLQLGGLDPDEVRRCLDEWCSEGMLVFTRNRDASRSASSAAGAGSAGLPTPDPTLDLPVKAQEAILAMHARLDRPYHELLGVPLDADPRAIKRAYFALSKEYHPDRYFRRDIGAFRPVLERVFRKIVEAYELLSDPTVRAEMQRSLEGEAPVSAPEAAVAPAREPSAPRRVRRPPSPFSPLGRLIAKRRAQARSFFEAAMAAAGEERWLEATGSLRLAIAFDPANAAYRERFGELQPKAHAIRFEQLMKEAESALSFRDGNDALRLYEEALHFEPYAPEANHTAARLAWMVAQDLRKAKEYALRAAEADPENADYRRTLGQIYQAAGLTANARRELKAAVKLNPKDREARAALKSL